MRTSQKWEPLLFPGVSRPQVRKAMRAYFPRAVKFSVRVTVCFCRCSDSAIGCRLGAAGALGAVLVLLRARVSHAPSVDLWDQRTLYELCKNPNVRPFSSWCPDNGGNAKVRGLPLSSVELSRVSGGLAEERSARAVFFLFWRGRFYDRFSPYDVLRFTLSSGIVVFVGGGSRQAIRANRRGNGDERFQLSEFCISSQAFHRI